MAELGGMGASIFACWWAWPSPVQAPALQYHYARPLQRRGLACTMWSTMGNWVCIWYVSGLSLVCRSVGQTTNSAPASGLSLVCQGGPPLVCQWSVSGLLVCQLVATHAHWPRAQALYTSNIRVQLYMCFRRRPLGVGRLGVHIFGMT